MSIIGCRVSSVEHRVSSISIMDYRVSSIEYRVPSVVSSAKRRVSGFGCRVSGFRFREFQVSSAEDRGSSADGRRSSFVVECRVSNIDCRVSSVEYRALSVEYRSRVSRVFGFLEVGGRCRWAQIKCSAACDVGESERAVVCARIGNGVGSQEAHPAFAGCPRVCPLAVGRYRRHDLCPVYDSMISIWREI